MEEKWKEIDGYNGLYLISNMGRVKSKFGVGRILKLTISSTYCFKVDLYIDSVSSTHKVHRLVGQAFIPNPDKKPVINHIDGNPLNNVVTNLEWCTQKQNIRHSIDVLGRQFGPGKGRGGRPRKMLI